MENDHVSNIHKLLIIGACVVTLLFLQVGLNGQSTTALDYESNLQFHMTQQDEPVEIILDPAPDSYAPSTAPLHNPMMVAGAKSFGITLFFLGCLAHEDS